jgi:undecaprenyl pyrophosphate phosphatase UppP
LTMVMLASVRWIPSTRNNRTLSFTAAGIIGCVQGCAYLVFGLSRFASTLVCQLWLGISPRRSLQFSFLMLAPGIIVTFLFNGLREMVMHVGARQFLAMPWLVTYTVSTVVAYGFFVLAGRMVQRKTIWKLGVYMLLPITMALLLILL